MNIKELSAKSYYIEFESEDELAKFKSYMTSHDLNPTLKAKEVMQILNISRPTLCHYVRDGRIKVVPNPTGKQYLYDKDSVLKLVK